MKTISEVKLNSKLSSHPLSLSLHYTRTSADIFLYTSILSISADCSYMYIYSLTDTGTCGGSSAEIKTNNSKSFRATEPPSQIYGVTSLVNASYIVLDALVSLNWKGLLIKLLENKILLCTNIKNDRDNKVTFHTTHWF